MKKIENVSIASVAIAMLMGSTFLPGMMQFSEAKDPFQSMATSNKKLITTADIADNAVTSPKIKDGEVSTNDIADNSVTKEKLNSDAVKLIVVDRTKFGGTLPIGSTGGSTEADCEAGEIVTGGGFRVQPFSGEVVPVLMGADGNSWLVRVAKPSNIEAQFDVFARCAHLQLGP